MRYRKTRLRVALSLLTALVLVWLAACAGGASNSGPGAASVGSQSTGAADNQRSLAAGSALPALPSDLQPGASQRQTSDATTLEFTGSGPALVQYSGGTADGDNLVLTSTADAVAWALYRADGLQGLRVTGFTLLTAPETADTSYGVGLSDFSFMHWEWMAYTTQSEVTFDLSQNNHRRISRLGNLYWVVAVPAGGYTVTVQKAQIAADDSGGSLPGGGNFIFASTGLPGYIEVQWGTIDGVTSYELYRREASLPPGGGRRCGPDDPGGTPGPEFDLIATVQDAIYQDTTVTSNVWYEYKIRAVNDQGEGGFSPPAIGIARDPNSTGANVAACGKVASITADAIAITLMRDGTTQSWKLTADTKFVAKDGSTVDWTYFQPDMFVHLEGTSEDPAGLYPVATLVAELDANALPPIPPPHHGHGAPGFGTITEYTADHVQITTDGFFTQTLDFALIDDTTYFDEQGNPVTHDYFSVGMRAFVRGKAADDGTLVADAVCAAREHGGGGPGQPPPPPGPPPPGLPPVLGAISDLTDASLTVADDAGTSHVFIVDDHTMWIGQNGEILDPSKFTAGERVVVLSMQVPDGILALVVHECDAGGGGGG